MPHDIIQIAGILDAAEARLLAGAGVDWLGFPLRLDVNAEDVTEAQAARIIRGLPEAVEGVCITYEQDAAAIAQLCSDLAVRTVQLHGDIELEQLRRLRAGVPGLFIIKSLVVETGNHAELEDLAARLGPLVDAFITDTYDPTTGARGATGKTHDWGVSRRLVDVTAQPVILAGGLTSDNVAAAIRAVRPAGVDAHTGVEGPDGRKDADKVRRFVAEARTAFGEGPAR